jgi:hypothetical protein
MSVNGTSGIVIDNSGVMIQTVAPLTDNSRGIIYYCNMFIVEATACYTRLLPKALKCYKNTTDL